MTNTELCENCGERPITYRAARRCARCYKAEWFRKNYQPHPKTPAPERRDPIRYGTAHEKLRKHRGPARNYVCVGCGQGAQEWSYDGGSEWEQSETVQRITTGGVKTTSLLTWSADMNAYSPRCRACHRDYDGRGSELRHDR